MAAARALSISLCWAVWQGQAVLQRRGAAALSAANTTAMAQYTAMATDWAELRRTRPARIPAPVQMRGPAPTRTGEDTRLFPGVAPGEVPGTVGPEALEMSLDNPVAARCCPGDSSRFLFNVTVPGMTAFFPVSHSQPRTDAALLVLPGGGYDFLAWEKEGTSIAEWANSIGVSAFVLKYRVPIRSGQEGDHLAPLQDAQRAISLLRHHAAAYGISKDRIGTIGFSAGGDLASRLSTTSSRTYEAKDEADAEDFLPNFQMFIYGAMIPPPAGAPPPPPTFIASASDDQCVVAPLVSGMAVVLGAMGAEVDYHMYPSGRHGYGDCEMYTEDGDFDAVCEWPAKAADFIRREVLRSAAPSSSA